MPFATTKMSSRGQVVIPEDVRKRLNIKEGSQFVVLDYNDTVMLKVIVEPSPEEFQKTLDGFKASSEKGRNQEIGSCRCSPAVQAQQMRIVIDTNILVSGLGWKSGPPGRIVDALNTQRFDIVVSGEVFEEYRRVLTDFSERYTEIDVRPILALITSKAIWVTPIALAGSICSDSDDDMFIAAAIAGRAKYIVSGDKALLSVRSFRDVKIMTPARFLATVYH